ncbi:hypothetical protein M436DRAFT_82331 [Aureobasidium namibiae CBS 147.97]|uniref:F-box domain-containing protein n=1 Tax=Aureobasidium namibiae CBS 147.97 TaxID=1043004 RepID=A0A074XEN9_9PEZI
MDFQPGSGLSASDMVFFDTITPLSPSKRIEYEPSSLDSERRIQELDSWHTLSEKKRKTRIKFENLLRECCARRSICKGLLGDAVVKYSTIYTKLLPSSKSVTKLQRLLRWHNDEDPPYLKWSRQVCLAALSSRGIVLDDPDSMSRFHCRAALDEADENASLRFMDLPREVRDSIYGHALYQPAVIKRVATTTPALLQVSSQVRKESQPVYLSINRFQLHSRFRIPARRQENNFLTHYAYDLNREDYDWLLYIGKENVAKIRRVAITILGDCTDWPDTLHPDLKSPYVGKWMRFNSCQHDGCEERDQQTMSEWAESCSIKAKQTAAEAENDDVDPEDSAAKAAWAAKRDKDLQTCLAKAQLRLNVFNKHCGKGKTVAPTIEGLTLLANAVHEILKKMQPRE